MTINITPELIAFFKGETNFIAIYEKAEKCTASHILFADFIKNTKWHGLPKVVYYILLGETFGPPFEKDETGCLGYSIQLKTSIP